MCIHLPNKLTKFFLLSVSFLQIKVFKKDQLQIIVICNVHKPRALLFLNFLKNNLFVSNSSLKNLINS